MPEMAEKKTGDAYGIIGTFQRFIQIAALLLGIGGAVAVMQLQIRNSINTNDKQELKLSDHGERLKVVEAQMVDQREDTKEIKRDIKEILRRVR